MPMPRDAVSVDVLVRWLRTPGNYKRWQLEAKSPLLQEIISEIKQHGAPKRSASAIRHRIGKLEQQYESATTWLASEGNLTAYEEGKASKDVKRVLLQRCPLYCELTPAFQSTSREVKANEVSTEAVDNGSNDEVLTPAELPAAQGKWKLDLDNLDNNQNLKKRGKQKTSEPQKLEVEQALVVEREASSCLKERSMILAEFQKSSESRWKEYCGAQIIPCLRETGEKMAQQIIQREIEHVEAMAKLQLEEEQKRQQLHTKYAIALSRHKLRSAGVSEEEVESTIPK